ncbi:MAG: glutathione S-transferase family protein [Polyangiaceae bacterium]|nr:glutathione S-transferase family protein [Polyangiaceae bacterium]
MKLYDFPWGPYPLRISIYLAEKGLSDVEVLKLEPPLDKKDWPPPFLKALTPAGSLPIVVDDDGTVIGQSLAILEYLEETKPGPDMLGATPRMRARTREMVAVFDEAIAFFGLWSRHGSDLNEGIIKKSHDAAAIGAERYGQKLRIAERMTGDSPFLTGDEVTIADCVAMATLQFTRQFYGVPIPADCPRLAAWYERFSKRASAPAPKFPEDQLALAYGLPEQTGITI